MRAPTAGHAHAGLLRSVLSVSTKARNPSPKFVTELLPTARSNLAGYVGARVPELVGVHAAAAEDGVLGELTNFSATTLPAS